MGDIKGFLKFKRQAQEFRPVCERIKDYAEVTVLRSDERSQEQASRCMDCGTPFCHWGCPVANFIPEWNDFMFRGYWRRAFEILQATNNFPEITARVCPAACEFACVLGINDEPVTICENELAIMEYAFKQGWVKPHPPKKRTGKKIAVIGSGPAGLACADQLNRTGHKVVVFERDDKAGGVLRYGIPDFKLEKWIIERRVKILEKEGIKFRVNVDLGINYKISKLKKEFAAVCLAIGAREPRDLKIEGRELGGIYFAMDYLTIPYHRLIDAKGKCVLVIGGGDTGSDCIGLAHRQGAGCVTQIEILPKPPQIRTQDMPWPTYPKILKTTSSHEEGTERIWSVKTLKFSGENGRIKKVICEREGREFQIEADLVILALGFIGPKKEGLIEGLKVKLDSRGYVKTDENYMTKVKGTFLAGDCRRGPSWVVWAVSEGRRAAYHIDKYLMGSTCLPIT